MLGCAQAAHHPDNHLGVDLGRQQGEVAISGVYQAGIARLMHACTCQVKTMSQCVSEAAQMLRPVVKRNLLND